MDNKSPHPSGGEEVDLWQRTYAPTAGADRRSLGSGQPGWFLAGPGQAQAGVCDAAAAAVPGYDPRGTPGGVSEDPQQGNP